MRRRTIRLATAGAALALGGLALVGQVRALDNVFPFGADVMERLIRDVTSSCPSANSYSFRGGGNALAMRGLVAGTQTVAPMTRPLSAEEACRVDEGATAESLLVGLDSLTVTAGDADTRGCAALAHTSARSFDVLDRAGQPVIDCPGCVPGTNRYAIADWRDVLALAYAGVHHGPQRFKDCDSPVRRSLVSSWNNLFQASCADGTCPGGLRRAFRRADRAGATDLFAALVGLAPIPAQRSDLDAVAGPIEFCNAHGSGPLYAGESDALDADPIRIPCDPTEQVCGPTAPGRTGTLGLVLVLEVPANLDGAANYPTELCDLGKFRFLAPALFGGPTLCPNGRPRLFNKCLQPVRELPGGGISAHCIARRWPVQGFDANGMDARTYNLFPKNANGTYRTDNAGRPIAWGFYRLHMTTPRVAGAPPCRESGSENDQIACLIRAQGCSLGFSRSVALPPSPGAVALAVGGVVPTVATVQNLAATSDVADDYPLARGLYLNTLVGFEHPSLQTQEYAFARCLGDTAATRFLIEANPGHPRFIPVPGSIRCVDFASGTCPASLTDACANNPADLITP